jgi:hypothetical protein
MKRFFTIFFVFFAVSIYSYMLIPDRGFPLAPEGAYRSVEPADSETEFRRAYFTNFTRQEVMDHYKKQFSYLPTFRLNYPPEDAQLLIRDQTRSVFLEELVHPLHGSVYVNGFVPKEAKDDIWYKGNHYEMKITVKYTPSSLWVRLVTATLIIITLYLLYLEYLQIFKLTMRRKEGRNER